MHLDRARGQARVLGLGRARPHEALGLDDVLGPQAVGDRVGGGLLVGVEHELHEARLVAQVDEHQAAVVAPPCDPSRQDDPPALVLGAQAAAEIGAPAHRRSSETRSSRATRRCSPVVMSRTAASPAPHSSSPTITTRAAPRRPASLERALEPPAAVGRIAAQAGRAGVVHERVDARPGLFVQDGKEHVQRRLGGLHGADLLERQHQPFEARAKPDAGDVGAAELLGEAVVAATPGQRRLRPERRPVPLPGRARVVVQAAHQPRRELVADAPRLEVRAHGGEVLAAGIAQVVGDRGRRGEHGLAGLVLAVEHPQRVRVAAFEALLAELGAVRIEERGQKLDVGGPADLVPDRVYEQPQAGHRDVRVPARLERDQLGVDRGILAPDRLGTELVVLPEAPPLHRVVAEHGHRIPDLDRLGQVVQAVLEIGPHHPRGALRTQRQLAVAPVPERIHLLAHDIGALARGAAKDAGVLERRRHHLAVAGAREDVPGLVEHGAAQRGARAVPVQRPPGGLELAAHARSAPRNGLAARSAARVVAGPWPGSTTVPAG